MLSASGIPSRVPSAKKFEEQVKDYSARAISSVVSRYQDRLRDGSAFAHADDGSSEETRAQLLGVAHAFGAMVLSLNISRERGMNMMEQIFQVIEESIVELNLPTLPQSIQPSEPPLEADGNPGSRRKNTVH